jgi:hypothetical protein
MMRENGRSRLPVLNSDGSALYIVHLSTLTDFIAGQAVSASPGAKAVTDLTIADLKAGDARLYQQILAWACVKTTATLADAKLAMETTPNCSDVFVTVSGRPSDPVVGWLTNVEIDLRS